MKDCTVQCSEVFTVLYSAVQCSAVDSHFSVRLPGARGDKAGEAFTLHCYTDIYCTPTLHCTKLYTTVICCNALNYTAVHCITLHRTEMYYFT